MSEPQTVQENQATPEPNAEPQEAPETPKSEPPKKSLEDLLADVDDDKAKVILDQVSKARHEAKNLRDRWKTAEPKLKEYEALLESRKTAEQKAIDAATAADERATKAVSKAVRSEIRAIAASDFADPDDAADALDATSFVGDDYEIDVAAIRAELADLLKRKPHWGKPEPGPRRPTPDPSQGSSGQQRAATSEEAQFANLLNAHMRKGRM